MVLNAIDASKSDLSDRQLSILSTGSTDTIRNFRRGAWPRLDTLESICKTLNLDFNIGPPRSENLNKPGEVREEDSAYGQPYAFDPDLDSAEHILVSKLDVRAAVGHGAVVDNERPVGLLAFRRDWLRKHNLQPHYLNAIEVKGESMMPVLLDGDTILVDRSRTQPRLGKIYAARVNSDDLVVKRLQKMPDDEYVLVSDNPVHGPILLGKEGELIGEVVWRGTWV